MLLPIVQILAGFVLLVWAADRLVAGASGLAANLGVSPLIIGLTIIGFGTSAPELVVSAAASLQGNPGLAVGNAIGSNIANVGLILGITALIYPLHIDSITLKREAPVLVGIMVLTAVLMADLELSRLDGIILAIGFMAMLGWMIAIGLRRGEADPLVRDLEAEIPSGIPTSTAALWTLVGLLILPLSSRILVAGAATTAELLQVPDTIIGLTIIALGTSLPELAAALASVMKREDDLAIGNILGSNMFNLLGVLGIAALVEPLYLAPVLLSRDTVVMFIVTAMLLFMALRNNGAGRLGGFILLGSFVAYQTLLVVTTIQGGQ